MSVCFTWVYSSSLSSFESNCDRGSIGSMLYNEDPWKIGFLEASVNSGTSPAVTVPGADLIFVQTSNPCLSAVLSEWSSLTRPCSLIKNFISPPNFLLQHPQSVLRGYTTRRTRKHSVLIKFLHLSKVFSVKRLQIRNFKVRIKWSNPSAASINCFRFLLHGKISLKFADFKNIFPLNCHAICLPILFFAKSSKIYKNVQNLVFSGFLFTKSLTKYSPTSVSFSYSQTNSTVENPSRCTTKWPFSI